MIWSILLSGELDDGRMGGVVQDLGGSGRTAPDLAARRRRTAPELGVLAHNAPGSGGGPQMRPRSAQNVMASLIHS